MSVDDRIAHEGLSLCYSMEEEDEESLFHLNQILKDGDLKFEIEIEMVLGYFVREDIVI
jgi:hypothetical protein